MKPLIVLLVATLASFFIIKLVTKKYNFYSSAKIGMSSMLFFTAIGHFIYTEGMEMMIPPMIPFKTEIIYLTGLLEITFGIFLLIPKFSTLTGWLIIFFLLIILPSNIYAAINHVNYQEANYKGQGINYLWFRVPLQILFIIWVYTSSIRKNNANIK